MRGLVHREVDKGDKMIRDIVYAVVFVVAGWSVLLWALAVSV